MSHIAESSAENARLEELRLATEALRRQASLLEKAQAIAHIGGWEIDLQTGVLSWTDETYRIHGLTREEYVPDVSSAISFYTPASMPVIGAAVEAAIRDGAAFDLELQIINKAGALRWVRSIGQREVLNGTALRICGVFQDITEQRLLESEVLLIARREQQQIGFDIHEGLGQQLTGISMALSAISRQLPAESAALRADVQELTRHTRETIDTCRTLAQGLSPVSQVRGGLIHALRLLCKRSAAMHQVDVTLRHEGEDVPVADWIADHLYRIAQESVRNAIQHASARKIEVAVEVGDDHTTLSITDDGNGFSEASVSRGMGLRIMRHRARLIIAGLTIQSLPQRGTRLACKLSRAPAGLAAPPAEEQTLRSGAAARPAVAR